MALGQLVAAWANIEQELCMLMCFLLRCAPWHGTTAFYAIVNNKARIDVMRNLGTHMIGQTQFQGQLNDLLNRVSKLADNRNSYVHKIWSVSRDGNDVYLTENIGFPAKAQARKVHAAEMREITAKIMQLTKDLRFFTVSYGRAYPIETKDPIPEALLGKFQQPPAHHSQHSDPPGPQDPPPDSERQS